MASNRSCDVVGFRKNSLLEKLFRHCPKVNSAPLGYSHRMWLGRRDRAILTGLGGSGGIRHLAVLFVFRNRTDSVGQAMIHKDILRRLLTGFYFLQFSALLLCLGCYSYRVKELVVCWLFFCSLFALLALMFLGVVLVCYAGKYVVAWTNAVHTVIPELAVCLVELPIDIISTPRILVTGTLTLSADPYTPVNALEVPPCLLIEVPASTEISVLE